MIFPNALELVELPPEFHILLTSRLAETVLRQQQQFGQRERVGLGVGIRVQGDTGRWRGVQDP